MRYKTLFCAVLFFILVGCTQKAAYNHLDTLVARYLQDYVELNDIQQAKLEQSLSDTLVWHRAQQLPVSIEWLQSVKQDMGKDLTYDRVAYHANQLTKLWDAIKERFANDMAVLLPTLTAKQRKELSASFYEQNNDYREEYIDISLEDRRKQLAERIEDSFEKWLDDLTEEQSALIRTTAYKMENTAENMLEARIRWQNEMLRILDDGTGQGDIHQALVNLFVQSSTLRSEAYQHQLDINQDLFFRLIVDISKTLVAEQKEYLYSRIDNYIELFKNLVKDGQEESVLREAMSGQ